MKKIILLTIIGIYFTFTLTSAIVLGEETTEDNASSGLFTPELELVVVSDYNEVIEPSVTEEITFKVKFRLNMGSFAARIFLNRRIGRVIMFGFPYFFKFINKLPKANISLSVDAPEGCQAVLDKEEVELDYNNEFEEAEFKLSVTIDEDAPALKKMDVTVKADYPGLGRIGSVSNQTDNISFMPKYESLFTVDIESDLIIPPQKETIVPINITNRGNGESSISISIKTFEQENWNITFDSEEITIDVGKTELVNMYVKPPVEFDNVPLTLKFTSTSTVENVDDTLRQGSSVESIITFYNDGSLEKDEGFDITMIIIIAVIILIIFVLVAFILKRR